PPPRSSLFPYTTLFRSCPRDVQLHRAALRPSQSSPLLQYRPSVVAAHRADLRSHSHPARCLRSRPVLRHWRHGICFSSPSWEEPATNIGHRLFSSYVAARQREIKSDRLALGRSRRAAASISRFTI